MDENIVDVLLKELEKFIGEPNAFVSLLILMASMLISYWLSHYVAQLIVRVARKIAVRSDTVKDNTKRVQLRRVETHLSVAIALVRVLIVGITAFYVWQAVSPFASLSTAAIGASAFFIVISSATFGMILRDITAGATMVIERWFNVGDFIRVEPFLDVSGVVERITLRSTKLRSLNGEVIWLHNQHIQAAKVTPHGLRTIAVDVFMSDKDKGQELIEKVVSTIPIGPLTVTEKLKIVRHEQWGEHLWLFTVIGHTPPGREWLIEDYFVESLKDLESGKEKPVLIRQPLVRYADPAAERSFRRAVRLSGVQPPTKPL